MLLQLVINLAVDSVGNEVVRFAPGAQLLAQAINNSDGVTTPLMVLAICGRVAEH